MLLVTEIESFNGPPHFKDHTPSPLCLSLCKGGGHEVSHQTKCPDCTHSQKMTVSIISWWGFIYDLIFVIIQTVTVSAFYDVR